MGGRPTAGSWMGYRLVSHRLARKPRPRPSAVSRATWATGPSPSERKKPASLLEIACGTDTNSWTYWIPGLAVSGPTGGLPGRLEVPGCGPLAPGGEAPKLPTRVLSCIGTIAGALFDSLPTIVMAATEGTSPFAVFLVTKM